MGPPAGWLATAARACCLLRRQANWRPAGSASAGAACTPASRPWAPSAASWPSGKTGSRSCSGGGARCWCCTPPDRAIATEWSCGWRCCWPPPPTKGRWMGCWWPGVPRTSACSCGCRRRRWIAPGPNYCGCWSCASSGARAAGRCHRKPAGPCSIRVKHGPSKPGRAVFRGAASGLIRSRPSVSDLNSAAPPCWPAVS